ncbi:MAG: class I SAM-dependent methyltransferase [Chthonomonadales bacterium]
MTGSAHTPAYISFDRAASFYDETRRIPPEHLAAIANIIRKDLGRRAALPFVEAGVGTGRFAGPLCRTGLTLIGLDISYAMLQKAQQSCPRALLARADIRHIPIATASVGGCLMVHVLHLIADWQHVLNEVRRILVPGASLYLGAEGGHNLPTRELYFKLAEERGLARPHVGAPSVAVALEYLASTGASVQQIDGGTIHWTIAMTTGEVLQLARRNPYSRLWHVPPQQHQELVAELERRTRLLADSLDDVETCDAVFSLWRVTWEPRVG